MHESSGVGVEGLLVEVEVEAEAHHETAYYDCHTGADVLAIGHRRRSRCFVIDAIDFWNRDEAPKKRLLESKS